MTIPAWLIDLGIPEDCLSQQSSASEKKSSFSINPDREDQIWRVKVDGCWLQTSAKKRVDYLFWVRSRSGRQLILLVELKGNDFGKALQQIESTLRLLCKKAPGQGIHTGAHQASPGHDLTSEGGVRAYVILSKGKKVRQRSVERERLRTRYNVRVYPRSQSLAVKGVDKLP